MQSFGLHRAKVAVILKYEKEQFVFIFFPPQTITTKKIELAYITFYFY